LEDYNSTTSALSLHPLFLATVLWYEKHLKTLAIASLNRDFTEWGGWAKSIKQLGDKLE
jgi:hypothetical protein